MARTIPHASRPRARRGKTSFPWHVVTSTLLCAMAWACASSPLRQADQLFASGAYADAAQAYEAALATLDGNERDRVRLQLALVHALPESPLHDPKRARRLLGELARDAGASPYKAQAKALLELENLRATVANLERAAKGSESSMNELEAQLASARQALERCERQLEELKRIDLGG